LGELVITTQQGSHLPVVWIFLCILFLFTIFIIRVYEVEWIDSPGLLLVLRNLIRHGPHITIILPWFSLFQVIMYRLYFAHKTTVTAVALATKRKEALPVTVASVRTNDDRTIRVGETILAHAGSIVAHSMVTAVRVSNTRN